MLLLCASPCQSASPLRSHPPSGRTLELHFSHQLPASCTLYRIPHAQLGHLASGRVVRAAHVGDQHAVLGLDERVVGRDIGFAGDDVQPRAEDLGRGEGSREVVRVDDRALGVSLWRTASGW